MHSNLIFHCHYSPTYGPLVLLRLARQWNDRHARSLAARRKPHRNDRNPDRRLRVGYVSGDFRVHPVGWFMTPVFAAHDRSAVEIFAYSASAYADDLTCRLRTSAGHWREVAGLSDSDLSAQVRDDRIDILVDLSGHTARHRLLALAEKPAPVQVTAVVPGTSGVEAIDYFLSDRFETPPGSEAHFSEAVIRLPDGFHCYGPPDYAPDVAPLPAGANDAVTFGCFNNLAKVTASVVALWAKVLAAVPGSQLLLKTKALDDPDAQAWYRELAAAAGIALDRLMLAGGSPHAELLAAYGTIDITLDPFPYSGGLTTLESLWMGVPVVTLSGETFAGRHSTSHLGNIGLPELISATPEEYVAIAAGLADDRDRLVDLRATLRARLAASPICDAKRYTRNLEAAYRQMWHAWCAKGE
jgi:predicted O-linked N-acetylglucosamine transferase (SPINDLY family)